MKRIIRSIREIFRPLAQRAWLIAALTSLSTAQAQPPIEKQNPAGLQHAVEQFMQTQTQGLPGEIQIAVNPIDKRLNLAECAAPEVFLPKGSRAWGKTTVGIQCSVPDKWTIYVQTQVKVIADYLVSSTPLPQGRVITAADFTPVKGDLTSLPPGIVTDPGQAIGRTLALSIPSGMPLRQDALKSQSVVQQGQSVRVVSNGPGFQVAADGRALANATEGQVVQARIASGQVVSGVARPGGLIEVSY